MTNNQTHTSTPSGQPQQTEQASEDVASSPKAKEQNAPTILIVEDDPVLSRMYSEKFKHEGFNVLTALDGEAGLKKALGEQINMILLDIMLPKLSGTDLLEKLRASERGKNIPVVALTNLAEQEEKDRALSFGVKEYLVKAMQTPEQVVEKIKKYMV